MKYKIIEESRKLDDVVLHRIQAVMDFGKVQAGTIGGWIQHPKNLSQKGLCWVADDAVVSSNATVDNDAQVKGQAIVTGNSQVYGEAQVNQLAQVTGNAVVSQQATVSGNSHVGGSARVFGKALIQGRARIYESAKVSGEAVCGDRCRVYGTSRVSHTAWVGAQAHVRGEARVRAQCWKTAISFAGPIHNMTILDKHVVIGCDHFTFDEFMELTEEQCNSWEPNLWQQQVDWAGLILEVARVDGRLTPAQEARYLNNDFFKLQQPKT